VDRIVPSLATSLAIHGAIVAFWLNAPLLPARTPDLGPVLQLTLVSAEPATPQPARPVTQPRIEERLADSPRARPRSQPKPEKPVTPLPLPSATPQAQSAAAASPAVAVTPGAATPPPVETAPAFDVAYLRNPPPAYPALAKRQRLQGRVLLKVRVDSDGRPQEIEVVASAGAAILDDAAVQGVRKWRFIPAKRNGVAIAAWVQVPVQFTLTGQ
jgi:protein TonB